MQNPQNTKFVSPAFNNQDPYYSTVGAAISAASTGSVVLIFPGTYDEIVSTTKRLHIVGVNKHSCVIARAANANQDVFSVDGSGGGVFSISQLTISQTSVSGGEALHIGDSYNGDIYLNNVILSAANEEALQINNAALVSINSCDLLGKGAGLYMANNVPTATYRVEVRNSRLEASAFTGTSAAGGQSLYAQACYVKGGNETGASTAGMYIGSIKTLPILDSCAVIGGTNGPAVFLADENVVGVKMFNSKLVKNGTATYTITGNWTEGDISVNIALGLCSMNTGTDPIRTSNLIENPNNVIDSEVS